MSTTRSARASAGALALALAWATTTAADGPLPPIRVPVPPKPNPIGSAPQPPGAIDSGPSPQAPRPGPTAPTAPSQSPQVPIEAPTEPMEPAPEPPPELSPAAPEPSPPAVPPVQPEAAPIPPSPAAPPAPAPDSIAPGPLGADLAAPPSPAAANPFTQAASLADVVGTSGFGTPEFLGDYSGPTIFQVRPPIPNPPPTPLPPPVVPPVAPPPGSGRARSFALAPAIRRFKSVDNNSIRPVDRLIFNFNYFHDVNGSINKRFNIPVTGTEAYRYTFGFEKTFHEGRSSFGMRLPINTLTVESKVPGRGGTATAAGDLVLMLKHALSFDPATGDTCGVGVALVTPTGPGNFGGSPFALSFRHPTIQPFAGFIRQRGDFFAQGYTAIDVPFAESDVTILYNDVAVGYYTYTNRDPNAFLSAVALTAEGHINVPLNHRGFRFDDPIGAADAFITTIGTSIEFKNRFRALFGVATPLTGPQPFGVEALALFNFYF